MDISQFAIDFKFLKSLLMLLHHLKTTITSNLCERLLKDFADLTAIHCAHQNSWEGSQSDILTLVEWSLVGTILAKSKDEEEGEPCADLGYYSIKQILNWSITYL